MSSPQNLVSCVTIPPLCNSDHLGLMLNIQWRLPTLPSNLPLRTIWLYKHADLPKARSLIAATDWDSLLSDDINESWNLWRTQFLDIMRECIPRKKISCHRNLPWINKGLIQRIHRRNALFNAAKRSQERTDFARYKTEKPRNLKTSGSQTDFPK